MITLHNQVYTVVRDMAGAPIVIRQQSAKIWRVASDQDRIRILAGLRVCPLRVVS